MTHDEEFGDLTDEEIENRRRDKELASRARILAFLDYDFNAAPINPEDPRIGKLQKWANKYPSIWHRWISPVDPDPFLRDEFKEGALEEREEFLKMAEDYDK